MSMKGGRRRRRRGSRETRVRRRCSLAECVCGRKDRNRASQRDRGGKSVSLDQLHSKSVYSAQFGIKHNRLLSACFCLWCTIKMEFIGALRVSPNYTFSPLCSILLPHSLPHLHPPHPLFFLPSSEVMSVKFYPPYFLQQLSDNLSGRLITDTPAALEGMPTYKMPISAISTVV